MGFEAPGIVMGHTKRHSHVWKSKENVGFIIQTSKPHFSPQIGRQNWSFEGLLWGRRPKYILGLGPCRRKLSGPRIGQ